MWTHWKKILCRKKLGVKKFDEHLGTSFKKWTKRNFFRNANIIERDSLWYWRSQLHVHIWTEKAHSREANTIVSLASERVSFNETLLNKSRSLKHSVCPEKTRHTAKRTRRRAGYITNYPTGLKNGVVF